MVAEEKFRDNLFFTLRQTSINVPPLRETTDDISDIADYLLSKYARKTQQPKKRLDASAIKALKLHPWPGNIRELKDVVLFAAFHVKGEVITVSDLRFDEARLDNAEDLTHRNSKAEKKGYSKRSSVQGHGEEQQSSSEYRKGLYLNSVKAWDQH